MLIIKSKQNKTYKFIKSLKKKKARNKTGFFIVEGIKNIDEAVQAGAKFKHICFSDQKYEEIKNHINIPDINDNNTLMFDDNLFNKLSDTITPQGILAVLSKGNIKSINKISETGIYVVLEDIRDPGNMGTLIRTCNAAKIDGIITAGNCVDIFSPKVIRAAMGGIFNIKLMSCNNSKQAYKILSKNNVISYALAPGSSKSIYSVKKWRGVAIYAGNESNGLKQQTIDMCDKRINIPMLGKCESLNASVAVSLAVYETVRDRL